MKKRKSSVILNTQKLGHLVSKDRLFIKSSKFNDKQMRRIELLLRLLLGLGLIVVLTAVFAFFFGFLLPLLQSKFSDTSSEESMSEVSSVVSMESQPTFDNLGLPVLTDDISLRLINANHPAGADYLPELEKVNGVQVQKNIAAALRTMLDTAQKDGVTFALSTGFISYEEQDKLYNEKVSELMEKGGETLVMARTNAKKAVPVAGESDFQTGLCVKIDAEKESFLSSAAYTWLEKNMGKYGFVFRFPDGKTAYTGLESDYTVLRYVGQKNAETMRQLSMCLEEYVTYLDNR